MELLFGYLFIFVARITDVSMATIRMLMIVKGKRKYAALIGFFEVMIYVTALGRVVSNLNNPLNLLSYASGFACGNFLGSLIEEKMAMGNIVAQVISKHDTDKITKVLRESGFGVTIIEGYGREGASHILNVTFERKRLPKFYDVMDGVDSNAFITITDARSIRGGYFSTIKSK
jgi:uncharacterized protein YebE (UPF0316 family)